MREVLPNLLWTGHSRDARQPAELFDLEIRAVVDVAAEESPAALPRELIYCRFPILDGDGNDLLVLRLAIATIEELIGSEIPTLIACGAGMSRSPALAAAAIARLRDWSLDAALKFVLETGSADVSPRLWRQIEAAVAEQ
jgi:protein-tyrosine phosphatase